MRGLDLVAPLLVNAKINMKISRVAAGLLQTKYLFSMFRTKYPFTFVRKISNLTSFLLLLL